MYLILSYVISAVAAVLLIVSVIFIVITVCKKQKKNKRKRNIIIWLIVDFLTIVLWSVSTVILGQLIQHETSDCIVSFNTDGGSLIADQIIEKGQTVSIPEHPEKDGFVFVGWYTDKEFNEMFNFYEPIDRSCTIFARWVNITDTTDTDGDGLPDEIEKYFGTDISSDDSDEDGLNDYIETAVLGYDPLNADTDNNGVPDADEDADRDGIDNKSEIKLVTNPASADTDADGINDYYELYTYGTDPTEADTDGDGADDGWEVEHLFDPLTYNERFSVEIKSSGALEDNDVIASALINEDGKQASSLRIETIGENEHHLLTSFIPGYLGSAYDFKIDGSITSATIIFKYDTSLGTVSDVFQPRIYYFNEEEGTLEELENQTVADGEVSVSVSHFSKYILLNKVEYDSAWNTDIHPSDADLTIDSNNDGIPDYYNDLILSGDIVVSNGSREFYGINFNYDAYGNKSDDYDGDGLKNGEELLIVQSGGTVHLLLKSNPLLKDTDGDGKKDAEDPDPLTWNISDRDLAMCCSMAYASIPDEVHTETYLEDLSDNLKNEIDSNFNEFGYAASRNELKGWKIIDSTTGKDEMQAVAFKVDSSIVVAYRGSQEALDWINDLLIGIFNINVQSDSAKKFLLKVMRENQDCDIYVTGHSLGGNLTYTAAAVGIEYNASAIKGIVTFNGLGLVFGYNPELSLAKELLKQKKAIIRDYRIHGDPVTEGLVGFLVPIHFGGDPIYFDKSPNVPFAIFKLPLSLLILTLDANCHNLYNFLEELEPFGRPIDQTVSMPVRTGAVLNVLDVNGQKCGNYHLTITTVPQIKDSLGNLSSLVPEIVVDTDVINTEGYILDLNGGTYLISVKDSNGNRREYKRTIKIIEPSIRDEYYGLKNVVIYTSFNASPNSDSSPSSEQDLKAIAEGYGIVSAWEYADYDGNGVSEAFAIITDEDLFVLEIIYISSDGEVTVIEDNIALTLYTNESGNIRFKEGKGFFWADMGAFGSGWQTALCSVKNNEPYKLKLCWNLQGFYQTGDTFYTTENNFLPGGGHVYENIELIYDPDSQEFSKGGKIDIDESPTDTEAENALTYSSDYRAVVIDCDESASGIVRIPYKNKNGPVVEIGSKAFSGCICSKVIIPASVAKIAEDAFDAGTSITIECSMYSAAYKYAVDHDIKYELTVGADDSIVYLEDVSYTDFSRYEGNEGDSFINQIGTRYSANGSTWTGYAHGLEAWIARWNYGDSPSWVWNEYDVNSTFKTLSGVVDISTDTYNKSSYDTTIQIIGDGEVLFEEILTPSTSYPVIVNVDVLNVNTLRIYLFDNSGAAGGTSFLLGNFYFTK